MKPNRRLNVTAAAAVAAALLAAGCASTASTTSPTSGSVTTTGGASRSQPEQARGAASSGTAAQRTAQAGPAQAGRSTDWTPLLKDWENACRNSSTMETFYDHLLVWRRDPRNKGFGRQTLGPIDLPQPYRQRVGKPRVREFDGLFSVTLPVTHSTYYGLPIVEIQVDAIQGNRNEISSGHLVLNVPPARAQAVLKQAGVSYRIERGRSGEQWGVDIRPNGNNARQTMLMCDFRNWLRSV